MPSGQHPAVGVAHDADARAGVERRPQQRHAVVRVVLVAVEEVLAVDEHAPAVAHEEVDGVVHHREVLLVGGAQGLLDVAHVGLGHQAHDRRLGVQQRADLRVVGDR